MDPVAVAVVGGVALADGPGPVLALLLNPEGVTLGAIGVPVAVAVPLPVWDMLIEGELDFDALIDGAALVTEVVGEGLAAAG